MTTVGVDAVQTMLLHGPDQLPEECSGHGLTLPGPLASSLALYLPVSVIEWLWPLEPSSWSCLLLVCL